MTVRSLLDAVAAFTIRSPWRAMATAVLPAAALCALLPGTSVDLTFMGVMNRNDEHIGRYFEVSERYELGGLLLVLLEGEEEGIDDAVELAIEAAAALPTVVSARRPLPTSWLEEQAPWLVDRTLFDRWLGLVERPGDMANAARFAASALALRRQAGGVPGARLVEIRMALDPLEEEVGGDAFFELQAAVLRALLGTEVTAGFSGLPAVSAGDQEQTLGAIKRLTPISLGLVLLLFRMVEKRPAGLLSVAAVLVLAIGAALGGVGLLTGKLTIMETFFGVTVFGLGIDFAVHLFVRLREERAGGLGFEEALRRTVRGSGRGVVAGCVTTAGAFLVAATAPEPVALHLGLSGGLGLLFCLPLTLLILPSVWVLTERRRRSRIALAATGEAGDGAVDPSDGVGRVDDRKRRPEQVARFERVRAPGLDSLVRWATGRPVRCLVVGAAVLAVALLGLPRLEVETRLERIMNRGVPALAALDRIQEVLGTNGAPWILSAESLEQSREFAARLNGHPLFSQVLSLGAILPTDLAERTAALARVLEANGASRAGASRAGASRADRAGRDGRTGVGGAGGYLRWQAVEALHRAAANGPPDLDSLPAALREQFIAPTGEFLVYAYPADSKADGDLARKQRLAVQAVDPGATGLVAVVEGMMVGDRPWIRRVAVAILAFVLIVLSVDFRRPRPVLLALVPVVAAVPFTLGLLCWLGIPFNVMSWLVLPLIFGLGIDDGIHVVHRILDDPSQSIRFAASSVGRAIAMTTLTTSASFCVLLFTDHPGLETMAAVMLIGLPACLLASVTVLPAAAVLLLGRR